LITIYNNSSGDLAEELGYWEHYYNWHIPHSSLGGKTPNEKYSELMLQTPLHEEVSAQYDPSKEHILAHSYSKNLAARTLKDLI
jgi:hypothetical protein